MLEKKMAHDEPMSRSLLFCKQRLNRVLTEFRTFRQTLFSSSAPPFAGLEGRRLDS